MKLRALLARLLGIGPGAGATVACAGDPVGDAWPQCEVFESSGIALALVDTRARRMMHVNRSFEQLTGLDDARVQAEALDDWLPDAAGPPGTAALPPGTTERRQQRPDGTAVWLCVGMAALPLQSTSGRWQLLVAYDIDRYKQAEHSLRMSERLYRTLWETTTDAVIVIDETDRIRFANRALQDVLGYQPHEVVGRSMGLLQPQRYRHRHHEALGAYITSGQRTRDWRRFETTGLHRDGHEVPLEIAFSHVRTPDGHLLAGFLRDISERKAAEQMRSDMETRLHEARKLEAIGRLAGGIAHDFNNVLGAIIGNSAMLLEDLPATQRGRLPAEQIQKAALRARDLVRQILTFSRRRPLTLAPHALQPLVAEAAALLAPTLPRHVRTHQQLMAGPPLCVLADGTQIEQVLLNLCTNASHAMERDGGIVTLGLDTVDRLPPHCTPAAEAARWAHLWVRDTGCGMDDATRARIFEPFFTTRPEGQGTGLGLAVVHSVVAGHGGALAVESSPGQGSTFHVYLPLLEGAAAAAPCPPAPGLDGQQILVTGTGEHVLYIDDDEVMVVMVRELLERSGFRITCLQVPEEAIARLHDGSLQADLVVTDFNMPGTTGLDVARHVHAWRPEMPIVLSSGNLSDELRREAAQLGVHAFVQKEETLEALPALLGELLARTRATAPAPTPAPPPAASPAPSPSPPPGPASGP